MYYFAQYVSIQNMRKTLILPLLFLLSCFSPMQTGPEPHSIDFEKNKFNLVINYFNSHAEINQWKIEKAQNDIPDSVLNEMIELGFLEYRNYGNYKVFFCGFGVVGKGWGFLYSNVPKEEIENSPNVNGERREFLITYLENIEGNWFRFAAG